MRLIIGLGNPGEEYEGTYHNAGALVLTRLWEEIKKEANIRRNGETGLFSFVEFETREGWQFIFVWPKTYMNESGVAVRGAMKFFKADPEEIIIFHDDSDLTLGEGKLSDSKNTAGHKGLDSVKKETGEAEMLRLRIGIRDPKEKTRKKAGEFVLKAIPKSKLKLLYLPGLTEL